MTQTHIHTADCATWLKKSNHVFDLSFVDPPFNQGKDYRFFHDELDSEKYWTWIKDILYLIRERSSLGGAIYFMQREKNTSHVLQALEEAGWTFQNLIIWKKKTSAVPCSVRFGKQYQIIVYATNGKSPRLFNRLRIKPPKPAHYKYDYEGGRFLTDIWDDIREMTSGFYAGEEALRLDDGSRFHKQQSPLALLVRIILSSTKVGDTVFDPFAGTGTTLIAAKQLKRKAIAIEIDPLNVQCIEKRLDDARIADAIEKYYQAYIHTDHIDEIWGQKLASHEAQGIFSEKKVKLPFV